MTGTAEIDRASRARLARRGATFALVAAAVFSAYLPAIPGGFVWDDDAHVTANPTLRDWDGLLRIWTDVRATPQYYPLTHTTFWIERRLFGLEPAGYRIVNLLLHLGVAWGFLRVLERLRVPGAPFAAAVFALHPVHVESVAWISERKNVLSGFLAVCALVLFLGAALEQGVSRRRRLWVGAASALLFAGAVLSKTVVATIPVVAFLLLWWRRGTLPNRLEGSILAASGLGGAALGLLTAHLERAQIGAVGAEWTLGILDRIVLAARVPWFYLGKLAWPADLSFVYPRWEVDAGRVTDWLWPALTLAAIAVLVLSLRKLGGGPLVAALAFGILLFPALGFFNVYPMRYSWVADHFQYHASLAAIALAGAGAAQGMGRARNAASRRGLRTSAVAVTAALAALTWTRSHAWIDQETLWRDTLARNPSAWMAHNNLAGLLAASGRDAEAIDHVREGIRLRPDHAGAHENLGQLLVRNGREEEGIAHLREATRLAPESPGPRVTLAGLLLARGRAPEAEAVVAEALRLAPDDGRAHLVAGHLAQERGRIADAIPHFRRAAASLPAEPAPRFALARALARAGESDEAIDHFLKGLALDPRDADARFDAGVLLARAGRLAEAVPHFAEALALRPGFAEAQRNLEIARSLLQGS